MWGTFRILTISSLHAVLIFLLFFIFTLSRKMFISHARVRSFSIVNFPLLVSFVSALVIFFLFIVSFFRFSNAIAFSVRLVLPRHSHTSRK